MSLWRTKPSCGTGLPKTEKGPPDFFGPGNKTEKIVCIRGPKQRDEGMSDYCPAGSNWSATIGYLRNTGDSGSQETFSSLSVAGKFLCGAI